MAELYEELGLTTEEYKKIKKILGREPTVVELSMYSVMWSEHCSYKSSKPVLKMFPTKGPRILQGPGENAGIIDIGDGLAIAMKIESHNHPSAIEPYQGAATGVGGILRDIFTMGARPIALLDPLYFGELTNDRTKYLFEEVVAGIAGYGNCTGVPTVAGSVNFEECYEGNPLVNVMAVGLMRRDKITKGIASGTGNYVIVFGNKTGRDGIGGVSVLASQEFTEASAAKRPSVQVGDPFTEKLLIEASLELIDNKLVVGLQDFGGAGLTCATCETSSRANTGMEIDVRLVEQREPNMEAFEIMVSESQERMLAIATPENKDKVLGVCRKWGLDAGVIGRVTDDGLLRVKDNGVVVGEMPSRSLADEAIQYERPAKKPEYLAKVQAFDARTVKHPADIAKTLLKLIGSPNLSSRHWVYEQYDHMVQTNTAVLPGGDAAVLRLKGTNKAISLSVDGNGRYCYLDPYVGAEIAVAEAARNVVATGAQPLAVTDCLNFGNPEKPENFWQFREAILGMSEACVKLDTPVVGGNVSFYNEWQKGAIYPTPVVGMLGLIEDVDKRMTANFKKDGHVVAIIGETLPELGGSEYLKIIHNKVAGRPPALDLTKELSLHKAVLEAIKLGLIKSAHDLSEGGLGVALAECCMLGNIGASINAGKGKIHHLEMNEWLWSETQSRMLVSLAEKSMFLLDRVAHTHRVPVSYIGRIGGNDLVIDDILDVPVKELNQAWRGSLKCLIS
jgi:phosphoribosylformylglycinamidine synthase